MSTTLVSKIAAIYDFCGIEYYITDTIFQSSCGIHKGDNPTALTLYYNQENIKWFCWTHNCHEKLRNDLIGLIQGVLSSYFNRNVSRTEAIWRFRNSQPSNQSSLVQKPRFIKKYNTNSIVPFLNCPSPYFIQRGFSTEVLTRYSIGDHPYLDRAIIPIFDHKNQYVGWTGRSLHPKCNQCKFYHNGTECKRHSKWYHNFPRNEILFNFNNASSPIASKKVVILTESPGNVLRAIEFKCYNTVAIFGCKLSRNQLKLLAESEAMAVILIMDADKAGQEATIKLTQKLQNRFMVFPYFLSQGDLGDISISEIQTKILPFINRIESLYS